MLVNKLCVCVFHPRFGSSTKKESKVKVDWSLKNKMIGETLQKNFSDKSL